MRKASLIVPDNQKNNKIFDLGDRGINRDNCMYSFYYLKKEFEKNNINLSTQDINSIENSEIVIYIGMPKRLPKNSDIEKSYLLIFESEIVDPENWDIDKHQYFNKIFTWNDEFVDNVKYYKVNFSHEIPQEFRIEAKKKTKFCTLISGNKSNKHKKELYSERVRAIQWFEKNHPNEFDFYGMDWNVRLFRRPFGKLNNFTFLQKVFATKYKSYKGKVSSKLDTMSSYKFAICYENARDIPGYITEKIFDCFFAGTIPIYWGAPNICDFIPKNCFIDKTQYKSYVDLYSYMKNMSPGEHMNYLRSIEDYVNSDKINPFSAEYFAETITMNVLSEILNE